MTIGAPVLFKRIQVGQVEDIQLTEAGDVMIDVFIGAPNNVRLTEATRFWNASGFSIQLGGGGASLNVDSLISLLQGGISFDNVGSDLTPVESGHVFELYPSEGHRPAEPLRGRARRAAAARHRHFDGSVRGLQPGAPVEYNGIRVGEVHSMQAAIDRRRRRAAARHAPRHAGARAAAPRHHRTGRPATAPGAALDLLESQVEQGLRAQLAASGLLTQTLFVDLAIVPDAAAGDPRPRRRALPAAAERAVRRHQRRQPPPRACCSASPGCRSRTW